jgi:hypothetical protein
MSDVTLDVFCDESGASFYGTCGHCQRRVDNLDPLHRVTPILAGGRGVECALRGDIPASQGGPLLTKEPYAQI